MKAVFSFLIAISFIISCSSPSNTTVEATEASSEESINLFTPFVVYKDEDSLNHYVPSGYMPNGECVRMNTTWDLDCQEGNTCIKISYDTICSYKSRKWAGVYWLHPADNWGQVKDGYNLDGATKLTFWARGETGKERIEEFKIGGVGISKDFPDTDSASIGPVILDTEWKKYTINLRGKDLSRIAGGFAWIASVTGNPEDCLFYLDHIQFE